MLVYKNLYTSMCSIKYDRLLDWDNKRARR